MNNNQNVQGNPGANDHVGAIVISNPKPQEKSPNANITHLNSTELHLDWRFK